MFKSTLQETAEMIACRLVGADRPESVRIAGVSKDSRTIAPGELYVPLVGERFDGHDYAREAFAKGAAAALWQEGRGDAPEGVPLLLVRDTLEALQELASAYRGQIGLKVIGVTGSNGKTTTKDLIASVLATGCSVRKTQGNLNNHIGLPMSILDLDDDTEAVVLEMGMSARGEIERLSRIAKPDIAVVTNIGEAHLLQLGSREEIARAKLEIVSGLRGGGTLIVNGDEPLIAQVLAEIEAGRASWRDGLPDGTRVVRFGRSGVNDLILARAWIDAERRGMAFAVAGRQGEWFVPAFGAHNAVNALAAIAAGEACGLPEQAIRSGLAAAKMTGMRTEVIRADSGLTVINDAYNASPNSMRAAFALLADYPCEGEKFVLLGDMLELGSGEEAFHREIGSLLDPERIGGVAACGTLARKIAEAAAPRYPEGRVRWFADKREAADWIAGLAGPRDVVLVKASRGMKLEEAVDRLRSRPLG